MRYIFIFNGREDKRHVIDEVHEQMKQVNLVAEEYITTDIGDATRYVNFFCDMNTKEEVCFVSCGGAGLATEITCGLVNRKNKYLAIIALGGTTDFIKNYPNRCFTRVQDMIEGERVQIDAVRVNDNYALNCVNFGMDAICSFLAQRYAYNGDPDPYNKGLIGSFFGYRWHRMKITIDGKTLKNTHWQNGQISNGQYTGGEFLCAPHAKLDDGILEFCFFRWMPGFIMLLILPHFRKGEHFTNKLCMRYITYCRGRHFEIVPKNLTYVGTDGEVFAATKVVVDVLPKALNVILPSKNATV